MLRMLMLCFTERYTRDIDQILADLTDGGHKRQTLEAVRPDAEDLSGGGLYPCVACDRHFIDETAREGHLKSKIHRRRVKQLNEGPFTPKDAEEAMVCVYLYALKYTLTLLCRVERQTISSADQP